MMIFILMVYYQFDLLNNNNVLINILAMYLYQCTFTDVQVYLQKNKMNCTKYLFA